MPPLRTTALLLASFAGRALAQNITYDYVIAGAGTAGMLLGVVLSENPAINVVVLEAGSDGRTDQNITNPQLRGNIQGTIYDWQYMTVPQPGFNQNMTEGAQMVPRGKTIGGTSALNWMIYNEDTRVQLDIWENVLNLTGWNWTSLSTAFREAEQFYAPPADLAALEPSIAADHGSSGPICSTYQRSVLSLFPDYLEPTLKSLGYIFPLDRNGGVMVDAGFLPLAICPQNYTRSFSGSAYTAVESRTNLHVITDAFVTGIEWASKTTGNATAAGLNYLDTYNGTNVARTILAREVILSGGVVGSPQILQLSGVGNSTILSAAGVQTVVDLPTVGTGLRDPPMANYWPLSFGINVTLTGAEYIQNFIQLEPASRILAPADYLAASTWLNTTASIPGLPDAQFEVFKTLWYSNQPLIEFAWQYATQNVTPYNLSPLSQGTVQITTSDPQTSPAINPAYNHVTAIINGTTVDWDMWLLAKASQFFVTQLATTQPMAGIITSTDPPWDTSFEEYHQAIFDRTGTSEHLTGGNPMLAQADGGVVDTNLLVYGTSNVRVVDGSVFPYQPSAHPMGLTYALAVRAARIFQSLPGGGGLTFTEQLPASNDSGTYTASFPTVTPTVTGGLASVQASIMGKSGVQSVTVTDASNGPGAGSVTGVATASGTGIAAGTVTTLGAGSGTTAGTGTAAATVASYTGAAGRVAPVVDARWFSWAGHASAVFYGAAVLAWVAVLV